MSDLIIQETHGDVIYREDAIDALVDEWKYKPDDEGLNCYYIESTLKALPSAEPEYKPVTAENFAKTMSKNTIYSFMAWHREALTLMEEMGFVICKKTM